MDVRLWVSCMPFIVGERRRTDEGCRERRAVVSRGVRQTAEYAIAGETPTRGGPCRPARARPARTANLSIASPALPPARGSKDRSIIDPINPPRHRPLAVMADPCPVDMAPRSHSVSSNLPIYHVKIPTSLLQTCIDRTHYP